MLSYQVLVINRKIKLIGKFKTFSGYKKKLQTNSIQNILLQVHNKQTVS